MQSGPKSMKKKKKKNISVIAEQKSQFNWCTGLESSSFGSTLHRTGSPNYFGLYVQLWLYWRWVFWSLWVSNGWSSSPLTDGRNCLEFIRPCLHWWLSPQTWWANHSSYCHSHTLGHYLLRCPLKTLQKISFCLVLWDFYEILSLKLVKKSL